MAAQRFTNVVCHGCSCSCDDLVIEIEHERIISISPACPLANDFFSSASDRSGSPAMIAGKPVSLTAAIAHAAKLLTSARTPLILGLDAIGNAARGTAVSLADRLGARIDPILSRLHRESVIAFQTSGQSTCSLGELRDRADVVVFWRCDPAQTHPRFMERYVAPDRNGKRLFVIDTEATSIVPIAETFHRLDPGQDTAFIWALREALRSEKSLSSVDRRKDNDSAATILSAIREAKYGVFLFGESLSQGETGHIAIDALTRLTRDLNARGRFHLRALGQHGDGADGVLCRQTGYPMSVSFAHGYPRYEPGDYSAEATLTRGECDCVLSLGHDQFRLLSPAAQSAWNARQTIVIGSGAPASEHRSSVMIHTAVRGVHEPGIATRCDDVPLPLRRLISSDLPRDEAVLAAIAAQVTQKNGD